MHLRRLAGDSVCELGNITCPVYMGLLAWGVFEVSGRAQLVGLCRELLAKALVGVRELFLCKRSSAVLLPEL